MAAVLQSTAVRFAPRRLGHANIFVGDLERSMGFFNRVCGIEEVRREPGIGAGFLSNGNTHHDIGAMQCGGGVRVGVGGHVQIPQGRGHRPGLNHLGWEMDNESVLAAAWRRAVAAKLDIHRTADHQLAHSVYVFDPDGNLHEFYADVVDDWRTVFNPDREDLITGQWEPAAGQPSKASRWPQNPKIRVVPDAVFRPKRMARAILVAQDLPRLRSFFTDVAGLEPVPGTQADDHVLLRGAATRDAWDLALFAPREGLQPGLHHAVFEVGDEAELLAAERRARAAGVEIELITDRAHKRSVFVRDPDGMRFEFRCARPGAAELPADTPGALKVYLV
jgi:catechol 2,3-dioxygenase